MLYSIRCGEKNVQCVVNCEFWAFECSLLTAQSSSHDIKNIFHLVDFVSKKIVLLQSEKK